MALKPVPAKLLRRMYCHQKLTLDQIGEQLGVSRETVRRWLIRVGIERRGPKDVDPARMRIALLGKNKRDENGNWKGGKVKRPTGYVIVRCPHHPAANPNGYVFEHRLVMESVLGRHLRPDEVVHHKNGIKHDNRPENLELMLRGEHSRHHNEGKVFTDEHKARIREAKRRRREAQSA